MLPGIQQRSLYIIYESFRIFTQIKFSESIWILKKSLNLKYCYGLKTLSETVCCKYIYIYIYIYIYPFINFSTTIHWEEVTNRI